MAGAKDGSSKRRAKDAEMDTSAKKKAKTQENSDSGKAVVHVQDKDAPLGTVLASFGEFQPGTSTDFSLYHASDSGEDNGAATMKDGLLVTGETPTVQYLSTNWDLGASSSAPPALRRDTRGYSGEYLLGVYDKKTQQVTLRAVPVFTLNRSVKALADVSASALRSAADGLDYSRARRDLGEAFGNKKQKQAARNMDRMKVNTENMDSVLEHVASGIDESVASLPTESELAAALNASRALPQANVDAEDPADVYALDTLLPPTVRKALGTKALLACQSQSELSKALRMLPQPSPWLLPRLWSVVQTAQNDGAASKAAELVRVGYYLALLLSFRRNARSIGKSGDESGMLLAQKMRVPDREKEVLMDDLLSRFAEKARGSQKYVSCLTQTGDDGDDRDQALCSYPGARAAPGRVQRRATASSAGTECAYTTVRMLVYRSSPQSQRPLPLAGMHHVTKDTARGRRRPGRHAASQALAPQGPRRLPPAAETRTASPLGHSCISCLAVRQTRHREGGELAPTLGPRRVRVHVIVGLQRDIPHVRRDLVQPRLHLLARDRQLAVRRIFELGKHFLRCISIATYTQGQSWRGCTRSAPPTAPACRPLFWAASCRNNTVT